MGGIRDSQVESELVMAKKKKLNMVCKTCGSDQVVRDAWAEWEPESQQWTLQNVFDYAYCESCEGECSIEEKELVE